MDEIVVKIQDTRERLVYVEEQLRETHTKEVRLKLELVDAQQRVEQVDQDLSTLYAARKIAEKQLEELYRTYYERAGKSNAAMLLARIRELASAGDLGPVLELLRSDT